MHRCENLEDTSSMDEVLDDIENDFSLSAELRNEYAYVNSWYRRVQDQP
jgi:hypothetical protein